MLAGEGRGAVPGMLANRFGHAASEESNAAPGMAGHAGIEEAFVAPGALARR